MNKPSYYTEEGLQRLKKELTRLKTEERSKVAEQLAEARAKGDLRENAEYDSAKEVQELLENKITKLEATIANARVLARHDINTSMVSILAKVKIRNKKHGQEVSYTLVSEEEADLKAGKISVASPIGKGLLGKKVGDTAMIKAPVGDIEFEILHISI